MQDQALDQCTNIPDWWMECGLSINRHALWHLNHKDAAVRFGSNPWPVIKGQASWSCAEKIFVVAHEGLIGQAHDQLNADPRLHVWDCLMYTSHVRSRPYLFWFDWTREVANQLDSLDRLDHTPIAKPFVFECMLGLAKPWREYIYNRALKHANILLGYQGRTPWVPGTDLDHDITASAVSTDRVAYAGEQQCNLSVLIPYKIYNSSWFSIVSETVMDRAFVSEKTAKVLLGKRLFVWFGAHRGLHHLKTFGFKTFDNVIDESYDDIQSPSERIQRAWQQVEHLLTLDPKWVHDQVRDRLSHNQQVLLGMTPKQTVIRQIQNLAQGA